MAIFDALDGHQHAPLRRAVFGRRLRGWGLTLVGLFGLATVLAMADMPLLQAGSTLAVAVVFGGLLWWSEYRGLRARLATAGFTTERGTSNAPQARRSLWRLFAVAALIVVPVAFDDTAAPAVGVVLAVGVLELMAARTLSDWERRNGRVLLSVNGGIREFYTR